MKTNSYNKKRCVYLIRFKNTKIVYVGLTFNFRQRINDHIRNNEKIIKLIKKYGLKNLICKKLIGYVPVKKAVNLEQEKINELKKKGYFLLNIRNGGSVGGGVQKWNIESISRVTSKFTSFKQWFKECQGSYYAAHRLNLLENKKVAGHLKKEVGSGIIWHPRKIFEEAKKYNQAGLFAKKSNSAYQAALRLGIYNSVSKNMGWNKNLSKTYRERVAHV